MPEAGYIDRRDDAAEPPHRPRVRVAQIFNLLYRRFAIGSAGEPFGWERPAECNSAIQQITNLRYGYAVSLGVALLSLAGCATNPFVDRVHGPSYEPSNVYREEAILPSQLKRLAVLPLTFAGDQAEMEFGRDTLWPVLMQELGRVKQFELVPVSGDQLLRWTGRGAWTGEEPLPEDFFEKLQAAAGVDGVLIGRLTRYRAYEPLAIGWRLKLMDTDEPRIIWSVDEVFDAGEPAVANAARRFAQSHPEAAPVNDSHGILRSPRRFAQYTASEVFKTLPRRAAVALSK